MKKNLKGSRVVLTRPDNSNLKKMLEVEGVEVLNMPLTQIVASNPDNADILKDIASYQWLCFPSSNAVEGFFNEFFRKYDDIRSIGAMKIACVGQSTARTLSQKFHLAADVIPQEQNALAMVEAMKENESLEHLKILVACGNLSRSELQEELVKAEAIVDKFEVYQTQATPDSTIDSAISDFVKKGANVLVFTSPSGVDAFFSDIKKFIINKDAPKPKTVAIGSTTASQMRFYSMPVDVIANSPSDEGLAEAIYSLL
ncbi:MAG: uroporphyrinogen-III synthase [Opitutales bacterium]